ncbi:DNA (cytosine-5-)-methyltransferase, partial [bacterium]
MNAFGELFAGAGGMALGLKRAGFNPTWAIDSEPDACASYRKNVGPHTICDRVENVDFADLPGVDGLAFGFPCNDFSMVGEKKGVEGYFGGLYKFAEQAIEKSDPSWFIAENVPGLMSNGGQDIMQGFADAGRGYDLTVHLFRFEDYGVPQRRWRVIGVGIRRDLNKVYMPPAATHSKPIGAKVALSGVSEILLNNELPKHSARVVEMLSHIPPGENCWHEDLPEHLRLNVEKVRMSLIYRRLHPDEPSYTVVAAGGGGTHGYHYE